MTSSRDPAESTPAQVPTGLVLFAPGTPTGIRRRRFFFLVVLALAALAVTWPGYRFFAGAFPQLLGLPQSLAWVVLWVVVIFVSLLGLYLRDRRLPEREEGEP